MNKLVKGLSVVGLAVLLMGQTRFPPQGGTAAGGATAISMNDAVSINFGTGTDSSLTYNTAQTPDALYLGVGADSNCLIVAQQGDVAYDFAHAQETDPCIFVQSANQSATEWIKIAHDQTNGVIDVGTGVIQLGTTPNVQNVQIGSVDRGFGGTSATMSTYIAGAQVFTSLAAGTKVQSDGYIGWSNLATSSGNTLDTAFARDSAGVIAARSGSTAAALGYFLTGTVISANAGSATPAETASGTCFTNTGDADGSDVTLPNDPTVGTTFCVLVTVAQTITITPNTGESLYMDADQCAVDMTASGIGANTKIIAATGGSGAIWIATGHGFTCNDA